MVLEKKFFPNLKSMETLGPQERARLELRDLNGRVYVGNQ